MAKHSHFASWDFCPCASISKIFRSNDFSLNVMKDLLHIFAQKVSLALSRAVYVLIREDKLNYFKFPLLNFKNSFCFGLVGWFWMPVWKIGSGFFFWYLNFLNNALWCVCGDDLIFISQWPLFPRWNLLTIQAGPTYDMSVKAWPWWLYTYKVVLGCFLAQLKWLEGINDRWVLSQISKMKLPSLTFFAK